jgi:hypothetical protein
VACPRAVGFQRCPMSVKSDCPGDGLPPGSQISTTSVKSDCPGDLQPNLHANWNLGTYRFSAMDPHISRVLGMLSGSLRRLSHGQVVLKYRVKSRYCTPRGLPYILISSRVLTTFMQHTSIWAKPSRCRRES